MKRRSPAPPKTPAPIAMRFGLAAALALAGLATALSLVPLGMGASLRAASQSVDGGLEGSWETLANGDRVLAVAADEGGAWLGTESGGLVRWTEADGSYRQYLAPQDGIPGNTVYDLLDEGTALWLATDRGLARFRPSTETWTVWTEATSLGMPEGPVTALASAGDGSYWVGFAQRWDPEADPPAGGEDQGPGNFVGGGIARFDPGSGQWSDREQARRADPVPGVEERPGLPEPGLQQRDGHRAGR